MTKKCACGNDMEDWMSVCKDCYGKQQDNKPENKERQSSIERQVAAKCAAQVLQGMDPIPDSSKKQFETFLSLIRGST